MSDSEDFDPHSDEDQTTFLHDAQPLSVKKYLPQANDLMDKILFTSYQPISFYPQKFVSIPDMVKADTAQLDQNNMNCIEESMFNHNRLKKDVLGFLLTNHLPSKNVNRKHLPTLEEFYEDKNLIYNKFPCQEKFGTYILDTKAVVKQEIKNKLDNENRAYTPISYRSKIEFNSNFESGNLFRVYQRQFNEYDLILQNDINTKGNNQWFFFSARNVPKNMTIKFNIVNLTKKHSLFDLGMKPYVFSMTRFEKRKVGWVRQGLKVSYDENQKTRRESTNKPYYCLSFQYKFSFEGDVVYFSHSIPYGLTELSNFLCPYLKSKNYTKLVKLKNIGSTLCGHEVDMIEIKNEQSKGRKKVIWIIGRQHSGEVTSSFMMEGIITYLLNSEKSQELLKKYIFKIVPMVNVDGVVHGNTRAQIIGADPNRKWNHPHKIRNPIIYSLRKAIEKDRDSIQMFLDLHSHSRKLGTFFYGNTCRDSKISTRKFPMMVCQNDCRFSYTSCRFSPCNVNSARHVLFESLNIPLIYTVESSFFGYQKDDHKIIQYMPKDYRQMGITLLQTLCQYSETKTSFKSISVLEEEEEIEEIRVKEEEVEDNLGSDSDPSGDQYNENELKKILPKMFEAKKKKTVKKKLIKAKKKVQKKVEKEELPPPKKVKKNLQQSQYRIYFSARQSISEVRPLLKENPKLTIDKKEFAAQVSLPQSIVLKGSNTANSIHERKSLCVFGQKVEEQLSILGCNVGIQADLNKVFTQSRAEVQQVRKNFKLSYRHSSILQVKENNFLNRGDCGHTMGLNILNRR